MRFMAMLKASEQQGMPPQSLMEAIAQFGMEAAQAGVLVEQGGLLPSAMGARIRLADGKLSVTDGPFTEAKEVIGGYAVYQVESKEEAIAWSRRFMEIHRDHWPGYEGEVEVRQIMEAPGGPPLG